MIYLVPVLKMAIRTFGNILRPGHVMYMTLLISVSSVSTLLFS